MPLSLLRRLFTLALSLIAASLAIFLAVEVIPGDPASTMLGLEARPETLAALRAELGLDQPPVQRYLGWVAGMLRGDFGISYTYRVPVSELIADRLAVSLPLAGLALVLAVALALPAGLAAAAWRGRLPDLAVSGGAQLGIAVPNFWLAMLLVTLFALRWRFFPSGGFPGWDTPLQALRALILPAVALALPQAAILTRVLRSALIDAQGEDFIRTARAKGLSRGQALRHHGLRNAALPVLTLIGLQFSFLLAGAIIIEQVFYLPGLGQLIFKAITQRDLITVESVTMLLVCAVIAVTFLTDVAHALADPRLRRR
ncbi:ABC transporter permease [Sagittula salina]|uniref:ABC transporter permease n=1 Tax=Sagittula salina TaxID=2820268 RepID=A0A940S3G7_9RHOB|nr:ABC transporter permease [Sagittula salina]MBP0482750.1 ABC transporter permease [Sagittula salina]